jgi:hypothetical protein
VQQAWSLSKLLVLSPAARNKAFELEHFAPHNPTKHNIYQIQNYSAKTKASLSTTRLEA